jgi:hypothetical protein
MHVIDFIVINAVAIYHKLQVGKDLSLTLFDELPYEQLVPIQKKQSTTATPEAGYKHLNIDAVASSVNSQHRQLLLKQNAKGMPADTHCYLWLLFGEKLKICFGCMRCQKAFQLKA